MPITCGDIISNNVTVREQPTVVSVEEGTVEVISVAALGPQGPRGEQGPPGYSGAGEPFYAIVSGELYATTASIAIFASVKSDVVPYTGSGLYYSLGSAGSPWNNLYVTSSIVFANSGSILAQIDAGDNYIEIGDSRITTSSFGFSNTIITKRGLYADIDYTGSITIHADGQNDIITASSSSFAYFKINTQGIVVFGEFAYFPTPVPGGVIFSGSEFYVGK